jgi:hypothetical protein
MQFLVDSGSDRTILHPDVNLAIRIRYHRLRSSETGVITGIDGARTYYAERGILFFDDAESNILQCDLIISLAESIESDQVPSILGRDFLNLCDVRFNHAQNLVALAPLNVDGGGFILPS